jgi:hypothetical protein
VKDYTYLGTVLTNKNELRPEIEKRITNANRAYYALLSLLKSQSVGRAEKVKIYKTLIRPVVTYGAEAWTLNKDIAKGLSVFERKILRRIFRATKVNENWRKRHNKELKQVFGDLDILLFVRISRLKWIGHVNRMENKRTVSQVFNKNPQGSRPKDDQETDGGIVYKQTLRSVKLTTGKKGKKQS